ncbi:MAG: type II toxin-antitoxin system VapC family toxin [Saprospiraceae bacterium]|nr:MAG: type II toxin-antitoxin system VapC family toxin [Saprospiraceae bacterium]
MNGKFLLDTNAVIGLLGGDAGLVQLLQSAVWVGVPVIVELEFLSFPNLSSSDEVLFAQFKNRVEIISLDAADTALLQQIIQLRRGFNLKLPDTIIAATALQRQAALLSNDAVFRRISSLSLQTF